MSVSSVSSFRFFVNCIIFFSSVLPKPKVAGNSGSSSKQTSSEDVSSDGEMRSDVVDSC